MKGIIPVFLGSTACLRLLISIPHIQWMKLIWAEETEKAFPDYESSLDQNYRTNINFTTFHSKYKTVYFNYVFSIIPRHQGAYKKR